MKIVFALPGFAVALIVSLMLLSLATKHVTLYVVAVLPSVSVTLTCPLALVSVPFTRLIKEPLVFVKFTATP